MKHVTRNNQAGVTLLISILIMSGLALISLTVGAFAIQELRASRAVVLAEPAISAAETAGEQGLWAIKRNVSLANCTSGTASSSLANGARVTYCKTYSSAVFDLKASTPFVFYLYDPNNINSNIDLLSYPYNTLTITNQAGNFSADVNVVRLDGTAVGTQPVTIAPGTTQVINIPAVSAGSEGRMKVTIQSTGAATVAVNTNQGLPNYPTVNAGGCAAKTAVSDCNNTSQELYSRRLNITVPE
jgi:Tfp pilus assembly protein PilX